jgi:hypothetical protein
MPLHFDHEAQQIKAKLKLVDGYVACESIVVKNVLKHVENGIDDIRIEKYLKELSVYLQQTGTASDNTGRTNFGYAIGFVNTLLKRPAWTSWIKTIEINQPGYE